MKIQRIRKRTIPKRLITEVSPIVVLTGNTFFFSHLENNLYQEEESQAYKEFILTLEHNIRSKMDHNKNNHFKVSVLCVPTTFYKSLLFEQGSQSQSIQKIALSPVDSIETLNTRHYFNNKSHPIPILSKNRSWITKIYKVEKSKFKIQLESISFTYNHYTHSLNISGRFNISKKLKKSWLLINQPSKK